MKIVKDPSEFGGGLQLPDRIVIHAMGENINNGKQVYSAKEWLDYLKLSAHYLIKSDGLIIQCRDDNQVAWHAKGFNTGSIGIEVLLEGEHDYGSFIDAIKVKWLKQAQYDVLVELCKELMDTWNITSSRIDRHSDLSPGRKVDPGEGFPWEEFKQQLL